MPLKIRQLDTSVPGAVSVQGIGAFAMDASGVLVPPAGAALTDEDLRRIFATLPWGYVIEEAEADPISPEPADSPAPPAKAPRSKGAQAEPESSATPPDPDVTTAPEGAPTPDGGDS